MKNTIIYSIVAIICVAALCITYAVTGKNVYAGASSESAIVANNDYMTEAEAAEYIGVPENIMQMMREKLGYFKGAYMNYIYLDEEGKEVKSIIYNKDELDAAVTKLGKETGALSFKFLQEQK